MNSSPLTSWEGAEAYFTFADKPGVIIFFCLIGVLLIFGSIAYSIRHESKSYKKPKK